jgi:hypothetical protein
VLNSEPDVLITLPPTLRIRQEFQRMWVSLQPVFSVTQKTDRAEIITNMEIEIRSAEGARAFSPISLMWWETGNWVDKADRTEWVFKADPSPLMVTHDYPQFPAVTFKAEREWLPVGRYDLVLVTRRGGKEPVRSAVACLSVEEKDSPFLRKTQSGEWQLFRRDDTQADEPCFHRNL